MDNQEITELKDHETDWRPDWIQSHFNSFAGVAEFLEFPVRSEGWYKVKQIGTYLVIKEGDYLSVYHWSDRNGSKLLRDAADLPWEKVRERVGLRLKDDGTFERSLL